MRYLNWLESFVLDKRRANYILLFKHLHQREYVYPLPMDEARAQDGVGLRDQFAREKGFSYEEIDEILQGPCSVLEMMVGLTLDLFPFSTPVQPSFQVRYKVLEVMVGLALRMEISLTSDPTEGDRTGLWFWGMLANMKLASVTDENYSSQYVNDRLDIMLYREYKANGEGGLFVCNTADRDMRDTDVWYQMNYFLIEEDERKEKLREEELRRLEAKYKE